MALRPARPGEEKLYSFCKTIRKRLENDWDIVIGVCGEEGSGKSTLSMLMGWYLDNEFTPKRNVIASPNVHEVSENLLGKLPRYSPVIVDEAIKIMYKLGWQNKASILMNTVMSVCRKENKVALLCMPRFMDFNEYNRQHRVKIWIEVVARGHAFVFVRDRSPFIKDAWHLKDNQKLYEKANKGLKVVEMSDKDFLNSLRRCKNYAFEFHFNDLDDKMKADYKILKDEVAATLDLDEAKGITKLYKEATRQAIRILYTENALTQKQISEEIGIGVYSINSMLADLGLRRIDKQRKQWLAKQKDK